MNIDKQDKERELFEVEFSKIKSDISFWVNTWDEDIQGYNHPVMCWIWHIWLASANREGHKIVPLSFLEDINNVAVDEFLKWKVREEKMPLICDYMQDLSFYIGVDE